MSSGGEHAERRRKLLQLASAAVFLAIVAVAVLIVVNANKSSGGDADSLKGTAEVNNALAGVPQSRLVLGEESAPVRLIEFGDLKCPICAAVSEEIVPGVVDSQIRGGDARIEFRSFTIIDDQSGPAGAAALAAGEQGRGWNFLEIFYRNQGVETDPYADDEFLTAVARAAGVADITRWNKERKSSRITSEVVRTSEEAQKLGFTGTPSFAIEGAEGQITPLGPLGSAGEIEAALESAG